MSARTWWSAKADPKSAEKREIRGGENPDLPMDDLLDARFDEEGRLSQLGRGRRQRIAERLDPRPAETGVDELELAVQKLSEGLEAIERQSRAARRPELPAARPEALERAAADPSETASGRDFVTYSLDRLEARLEALSKRLQQRTGAGAPAAEAARSRGDRRSDPSLAVALEEDLAAQLAESQRLAEAEEAEEIRRAAMEVAETTRQMEAASQARRDAEVTAEEQRRQAEIAEARRRSEVAEARRQAELAETRRQAEVTEARRQAELAEARRQAEAEAAAEERRLQAELAEARRQAEADAAAEERRRQVEEVEAIRLADLAEARRNTEAAEARHRAEAEEARRQAEIAAARREAETAAVLERQFAEIEGRIDALQKGLDENQIEPVREELLDLVQQISDLSRSGRATAGALDEIGIRLDQMEVKLNAARNMAGNRLGDIQDRLSGLVERLDEIEVEIPGFDAVRLNQSAILERFDRMEGLVHRLASPEELFERVDGLKRQMQTIASQREVARIEEQILQLAERLDALPEDLSDKAVLERIEDQLGGLAAEFTETRRQRKSVATELEEHLSELSAQLRDVAETGRTPDLTGLEDRISNLGSQLAEDRRFNSDTLARLERRLGALTEAIETQEDDAAAEILGGLTQKIDSLAEAIDAQDTSGARRDIEGLGRKLDQLADQLVQQAESLSRRQAEPLETRLDDMQGQLEELARGTHDSHAQLRPVGQKLQEISDRLTALGAEDGPDPLSQRLAAIDERIAGLSGKAADPRALQTQIDSIVSRLELLKGRSIDPARLNELFDRVDAAMRALPEERFDRLEQRLEETIVPAERFDRLEKKIAETAAAGATADRFSRLERKLDEIGRVFTAGGELLTQEDLTDLRSDIVALRRELRSLPGQAEANLGELMRTLVKRLERLPQDAPATVADLEAQVERIAGILEDPSDGRMALAHIETSLKTIEKRLDDTRRSLSSRAPGEGEGDTADAEMESVAGLARALSDDVTVLKTSAEATERKTRDAIDAVQNTLEAVIKRMAFLERDADTGGAAEERRPTEARGAEPLPTVEPEAAPASEATPEQAAAARDLADQPPASLLSRLTSRQLLKRATGGRTESFSPEAEESDDASDFPLEPGTDAPLSSALTGAPSSNTEFMSGARKGRLTQPFAGDADRHGATGRAVPQPAVDDDFLAAARRAARAAAQEVTEAERGTPAARSARGFGRIVGAIKAHRRALLVTAIAAALVIAALPIARTQLWPGETEVASLPEASTPVVQPEAPAVQEAPAPSATAPELTAATPEMTALESLSEVKAPAAPAAELRPEQPENVATQAIDDERAATAFTESETATAPSAASEPVVSGTDVAAITPSATPGTDAAAVTPPADATQAPAAALPESIGPARLRDAAIAGDSAAAFEVAARYAEGRGVLPDMPTAVSWYERAAEADLAPAQYRLGSIYEKGLGVTKDLAAAQKWYGRAADAGNVKAMHNLAVLYAEGAGGTPDLERASDLFRRAAERGVRDSQFNLAILHARGLGVPQDLIEAYKWFGIAASSGDEESAKRRDIIGEALADDDRATAEAAVASFQLVPLVSEANEVLIPEGGWTDSENSTMEVRSDNELVALVQKLLAENGYDPGPADGLLGRQTIDAISEFQDRAGLPKTGQIDTGLVAALQAPST